MGHIRRLEAVKLFLQSDENYLKVEAAISRILQRHTKHALNQVAMESPIGSKLLRYKYAPSRCPNCWEDINKILLIILGLHFGDLRDFQKFLGRTPRGDASQETDLAAHQCSFTHAVAFINSHFHHTAMIKYEEAAGYTILGIYVDFFCHHVRKGV